MFGPHLTLDFYYCSREKISNSRFITRVLDELPDLIGMTKISKPYVMLYNAPRNHEEWGLSGFVIIAESHISIHTFPEKEYASVDIFSCKPFDQDRAIGFLTANLDSKKVERRLIMRGREFQREVQPKPVIRTPTPKSRIRSAGQRILLS